MISMNSPSTDGTVSEIPQVCQGALSPSVTVEQFFDAPVYIRTWFIPEVDLSTFSFGLMYRVVDIIQRIMVKRVQLFPTTY